MADKEDAFDKTSPDPFACLEVEREIIRGMTEARAKKTLLAIYDVLWPPEDPEQSWSADTINDVDDALRHGISCAQGQEET